MFCLEPEPSDNEMGGSDSETVDNTQDDDLQSSSVKELKALAKTLMVDISQCIEKADIVKCLKDKMKYVKSPPNDDSQNKQLNDPLRREGARRVILSEKV